jgi:hypothetical protein
MIRIFYIKDGYNITGEYTSIDVIPAVDYLDITNIKTPPSPPETWYIEDGQIKVDQEKLIEFNRKNMPTLTPIEFDLKLRQHNLYAAVQTLIAGNRTLMIAYTRATYFSRTDSFTEQARLALNLTHEQIDEMWVS